MKDFKVKCVDELPGVTTKGKIYEVVNGVLTFDNGNTSMQFLNIETLNNRCFSKFELVEDKPQQFTKDMLKTGMRVEFRDGRQSIVLLNTEEYGDLLLNCNWTVLDSYTDDLLRKDILKDIDIVKVYSRPCLSELFDIRCKGKLLWQRPEPMKVTIPEAEAMLTEVEGKPVKIVKE